MMEAASVRTHSTGAGWLTAVAALLLIGAVVVIATSASSGPDEITRAPAAILPETAAAIAPQGLITYEVTGKGFFTARASGEVVGEASAAELAHVHNAGAEDRVLSPDGKRSVRIDRNEQGVFLAVGAPGAEQLINQIAGPSDPALVAGGKGAARAVDGIPLVVAWSPDSKQIAYGSITGEPWPVQIYTVGGINPFRSYEVTGGYVGELAWSPDGRYLAVSTYSLDRTDHTVLMLDTTTDRLEKLIDGCHLTWSPDSRYLAIHRDPGPEAGAWIISPDGDHRFALSREPGAFPYVWHQG